ncbi:shikimate dehydrogenase family protein [Aquimarina brevivitae]|uniref:Shikimate dehydrogenase n=1 Tax=Aquimarina brevivitae TaxID=323412 RepID=A0A4Q7PIG2_9FLAO|nr:shikimate dehydrogenase [Aquimarina brevivitae]RZT00367.1 shikimate dehydrogenase [Aquimarina brevivitae]
MKLFGLVGKNIGYSFSKTYFAKKFKENQLNNYTYQNFDITDIDAIRQVFKTKNLSGLNVTIPYKEQIVPYLDDLDPTAKAIGAVNVIKIDNNKFIGYNSDCYGFSESLKPLLQPAITKALILGTGGASKAVAYALQNLGITSTYVSRSNENDALHYDALTLKIIENHKLIINCTPLGTHPNVDRFPNIPYEYLESQHILYDLIYNPSETLFMKKGKKRGATVINGYQMLVLQAEKSWEIWHS